MNLCKFDGINLLVVGDIIVDEYVLGNTVRLSREAPIPVIQEESRCLQAGGAANVVSNIYALGGNPILVGVVGRDKYGEFIQNQVFSNWETNGIIIDDTIKTNSKTRIIAGNSFSYKYQVARLDSKFQGELSSNTQTAIVKALEQNIKQAQGIIVSDYSYGVISENNLVFEAIHHYAYNTSIPVFVDSRNNINKFHWAHTLTPNNQEMQEITHYPIDIKDKKSMQMAVEGLNRGTLVQNILLKLGQYGMALWNGTELIHIPAYGPNANVADTIGAGDSVISAYALSICSNTDPITAAKIANVVGGISVTKHGTIPVTLKELNDVLFTIWETL